MSWQSRTSSLKEKIKYLLDSKEMSDITIIVGKDKVSFQTHSLLLSIFSEVFQNMFYGPNATKESEVLLPEVNADAFDIFMKYVYTDAVVLNSEDEAVSSLMFAYKYKVPYMKNQCIIYLNKTVSDGLAETATSTSSASAELKTEGTCGNVTIPESYDMQNKKSSKMAVNSNYAFASDSGVKVVHQDVDTMHPSLESLNEIYMSTETGPNLISNNSSMKAVHQDVDTMQSKLESSNEIYMSTEEGPNIISNQNDTYSINPTKHLKHEVRNRIPNYVFDVTRFAECLDGRKNSEELLKFVLEGNLYPETSIPRLLREWGWWINQEDACSCIQLKKLNELLQNQLRLLKESNHENVCFRWQNNSPNLLKLSSKCIKTWISSSDFPCIEERFKSKECNLHVYGVSLNFKFNTNLNKKIDLEAVLEITNLTRNIRSDKIISIYLDESNRGVSLKLEYPVFIGKDEICKIVVKSDTKLENCEFVYCSEACALDNRLERLSTDSKTNGHFSAIIVLIGEE